MNLAEALKRVPRRCRHGHLLTGDNIREERNRSSKGGVRFRCKACVSVQKRRVYIDPLRRFVRFAYEDHYRNGHPEGLSWCEIKQQFEGRTS